MNCDILFYNGTIFNTTFKKFYNGFFATRDGCVLRMGEGEPPASLDAKQKVNLRKKTVVPGLIDVHMHIESSMLAPLCFADELVKHGITTIVSEPHEMANVAGADGIFAMINAGKGAPLDIYYGAPSSVPSTSLELETTGGVIDTEDLAALLANPDVKCLGEVMNTRDVVYNKSGKTNGIIREFKRLDPRLPREGHCPRLVGDELAEYLFEGVDSDHTDHTMEEFKERYFNGMFVEIQDKTLTKELVDYVAKNDLYTDTALVTDDVMADEFVRDGGLDYIVRRAIALGMSPENAIYCATKTPAVRMLLNDRGDLRPGKLADFAVLSDLNAFCVEQTYKKGNCVFDRESHEEKKRGRPSFDESYFHSVKLEKIGEDDFTIECAKERAQCRVIETCSDSTATRMVLCDMKSVGGQLLWENSEILQVKVFERYGINKNSACGLVTGALIKHGAIASTYCHDHHNLIVAGSTKCDMAIASNCVIEMSGGLAVVLDGKVIAKAALPIGGILSDKPAVEFAKDIENVTAAMRSLGYDHYDPIMSFCTLSLPVSPDLKITDVGLIEVKTQKKVDLFVE
ncbi:MAG: adenine deaminase C-terminal domain-containing protein [Oscillospiraceae bacterium]